MIYLGSLAQILSVSSASFAVVAALWGAKKEKYSLILLAKQAGRLHLYLLLVCVFCLLYALALPDFSVAYVTEHVNHKLPMFYRLTSIWAGQAGSMLWWNFLLVLFSVIAIEDIQKKEPSILPYSIAVLMGSSLFFRYSLTFLPIQTLSSWSPQEGNLSSYPMGGGSTLFCNTGPWSSTLRSFT